MTPAARAASISARSTCSSGPYSCRMKTQPCSAPMTAIPMSRPSNTRCGCVARICAVLEGAWLGLVGVADHVFDAGGLRVVDYCPLLPGGEAGTAHAAEARVLDGADHVVGVQVSGEQRPQRRVPLGNTGSCCVGIVGPRLCASFAAASPTSPARASSTSCCTSAKARAVRSPRPQVRHRNGRGTRPRRPRRRRPPGSDGAAR